MERLVPAEIKAIKVMQARRAWLGPKGTKVTRGIKATPALPAKMAPAQAGDVLLTVRNPGAGWLLPDTIYLKASYPTLAALVGERKNQSPTPTLQASWASNAYAYEFIYTPGIERVLASLRHSRWCVFRTERSGPSPGDLGCRTECGHLSAPGDRHVHGPALVHRCELGYGGIHRNARDNHCGKHDDDKRLERNHRSHGGDLASRLRLW